MQNRALKLVLYYQHVEKWVWAFHNYNLQSHVCFVGDSDTSDLNTDSDDQTETRPDNGDSSPNGGETKSDDGYKDPLTVVKELSERPSDGGLPGETSQLRDSDDDVSEAIEFKDVFKQSPDNGTNAIKSPSPAKSDNSSTFLSDDKLNITDSNLARGTSTPQSNDSSLQPTTTATPRFSVDSDLDQFVIDGSPSKQKKSAFVSEHLERYLSSYSSKDAVEHDDIDVIDNLPFYCFDSEVSLRDYVDKNKDSSDVQQEQTDTHRSLNTRKKLNRLVKPLRNTSVQQLGQYE